MTNPQVRQGGEAKPIRTWRLVGDEGLCEWVSNDEGPTQLSDGESVRVIELEPLLDLLERMTEALKVKADPGRGGSPTVELTQLRHDVLVATDLLCEHGRLP